MAYLLETAARSIETSTEPREFIAQGDRVLAVGFATGRIKATNKTFEEDSVFAITVRCAKPTSIRKYASSALPISALRVGTMSRNMLQTCFGFENRVPITSLLLMSAIDNAGLRPEQ